MQVMLNGEHHDITNETTLLVSYRTKSWRHMNCVLHNCGASCQDASDMTIVIYDVRLFTACRGQRINELLQWQPDEADLKAWDMHTQRQKELPFSEEDVKKFIDDAVNEEDIWKELL